MNKRVFLVVTECLGVGEAPDSFLYGDNGSDTLNSLYMTGKLNVPFLRNMGLFNIDDIQFGRRSCIVEGAFGKCIPSSVGKSTEYGYLELAGHVCKGSDDASSPSRFETSVDLIKKAGMDVICVGRAAELFGCEAAGNTSSFSSIRECINAAVSVIRSNFEGLSIISLPTAVSDAATNTDYSEAARLISYIDKRFAKIVQLLRPGDIIVFTAIHGLSPGGGYTRENVPVLVYGEPIKRACAFHTRNTTADISATVLDYLNINNTLDGESFLPLIVREQIQ